ncbi:MAG: hypothetical protein LWW94_05030 [Candidatus Desulfofervidaceae bacterium]|nr:hypothetical protein [Candidatus Desulfofervidaceae bacterium]
MSRRWMSILSFIGLMCLTGELKAMPLKVDFQVPYGQKSGFIIAHTQTSALLVVENLEDKPVFVTLKLEFPAAFKVSPASEFSACFSLPVKHAKWFRVIDFSAPTSGAYSINIRVTYQYNATTKHFTKHETIRVLDAFKLKQAVHLQNFYLPADVQGRPLKAQRPYTLILRSPFWSREQKGISPPATYLGVILRNNLPFSVPVVVHLKVCNPKTGKRIAGFDPQLPPGHGGLSLKGNYRLVMLPPHQTINLSLPVYGEADTVLPGQYQGKLTLKFFGTELILAEKTFPLHATSRRQIPLFNTCLAIVLDLGLLIGFIWQRYWLKTFKMRHFMTITLFGASIFAVVNLPGHFLFQFAHLCLGPFAFFITGLFYEIIFYILLVALVWLIPCPGVTTLAILIRSLLNDFLFGSFTPASLLALGPYTLFLEAAFYVSGLTRGQKPRLTLALWLGLADAAISYITLNLFMVLYRLYYADWYIWLYLLVPGFLYTFVATFAGIKLGQRLKCVNV